MLAQSACLRGIAAASGPCLAQAVQDLGTADSCLIWGLLPWVPVREHAFRSPMLNAAALRSLTSVHRFSSAAQRCRSGKRRLASQFDDLQRQYLQLRRSGTQPSSPPPTPMGVSRHTASLAAALPIAKRKRLDSGLAHGAPAAGADEDAADGVQSTPQQSSMAALQQQQVAQLRHERREGPVEGLRDFASMLTTLVKSSKLKVRSAMHLLALLQEGVLTQL